MYACIHAAGLTGEAEVRALIESFTPVFGFAPEIAVLDIRGLRSLFGAPQDIAQAIRTRAQAIGMEPSVAIAAHPDTAVAAARGFPGITIVPPGEESRVLGPLPLALLAPSEELQETLANWGIRTFAELAALPDMGIAERLGEEGVELQKLARGWPSKPLVPFREPATYEASLDLEHPLELLEPLSFVLSRLLNEICARLREQGMAANEVVMRLALEDRTEWVRTIRLPFATREAPTFVKLLQYDVTSHPPAAAIVGVRVAAQPVAPRTAQGGLFVPLAPEPERLELTLARIFAIVGPDNAGAPELLNTHRPGAFRVTRFVANGSAVALPEDAARVPPRLSIRLFRPPLPACVTIDDGRPARVAARGMTAADVVEYSGPWRTCGEWWTDTPWAREEWDVAFPDGKMCRIYREHGNEWFVDGTYD